MSRCRGPFLVPILLLLATAARADLDVLPLAKVEKGMTGYGLTVFEGIRIERFPVEVVDVIRAYLPKQDVILVRCGGRASVDQFGVAAGMSGSPIYLEGKLAGALAYGWDFANEALAGITPIEAMIRDTSRPAEHGAARPAGRSGGPRTSRLRRLAAPLIVSGLAPAALDRLESSLRSRHLRPVRGGGGGSRPGLDDLRLEPGAACSVDLMRGDVSASILGTVTAVDGDRVLAFGHSFFDSGERIWPLATAWVNYTVGSPMSSFKMGESGRPVGALIQDRQAAVAGVLGRPAPLIPAVVRVKNGITGREDTFRVEVVRDPVFTTIMLSSLISQALIAAEGAMQPTRVRTELRLHLEGRETSVVSRDLFASQWGVDAYGASAMISRLLDNPFGEVKLARVELDAEVVHDQGAATIETVLPERQVVSPGEEVRVRVTLRPRRGERRTYDVPVSVPEEAVPGRPLVLMIMGGDDVSSDAPAPDDVEGVIRMIEAFSPSTDLVVEVPLPRIDVTRRGRIVRNVPASILEGLLPSAGDGAVRLNQAVVRTRVSTDWAVRGSFVLKLNVVKSGR